MKKVLLGTVIAIALLSGCTEEKKAPAAQAEATTPATQTTPATEAKTEATAPATQNK